MAIIRHATTLSEFDVSSTPTDILAATGAAEIAPHVEQGVRINNPNNSGLSLRFAPQSDFWVSFYMRQDDWFAQDRDWVQFYAAGSLKFFYEYGGTPHFRFRSSGSTLGANHGAATNDQLIRFDMHIVIADTNGLIEIYHDKLLINSFTGDTNITATGNLTVDQIVFFNGENGGSTEPAFVSAVIIADEDTRPMEYVQRNLAADGGLAEFTGSVADVDDVGLDDADKITTTAAATSTFTKGAIPAALATGYDVKTVGVSARAQAGTNAPAIARLVTRANGTVGESSDNTLSPIFGPIQATFDTNPDTGQPWTIMEVDAAEVGIKVL